MVPRDARVYDSNDGVVGTAVRGPGHIGLHASDVPLVEEVEEVRCSGLFHKRLDFQLRQYLVPLQSDRVHLV